MIIWCDLETTGLDPQKDQILEMALVVTDDDLNVQSTFEDVFYPKNLVMSDVSDVVIDMHFKSNLFEEAFASPRSYTNRDIFHFLNTAYGVEWAYEIPEGDLVPLAGSSVHFDRSFLEVWYPDILSYVSHRNLDVSSFREINKRWFPGKMEQFEKKDVHRAMPDVLESIEELKFYRLMWDL